MNTTRFLIASAIFISTCTVAHADWPSLGGGSTHSSNAPTAPITISNIWWQASTDLNGAPFVFEGPSSPVVFNGRVFANAKHFDPPGVYSANKLVAMNTATGEVLFETIVDIGLFDSWSSPTVDTQHATILIGSGSTVYSIDAIDGHIHWETQLDRAIVNASVTNADGHPSGRALITDFNGFGTTASLYCINTGAFDAIENPYEPGDIVWQEQLGSASGATPAYADRIAYVACISEPTSPAGTRAGHISAYDIDAPDVDRLIWRSALSSKGILNEGFFGGVTLVDSFVYAASYDEQGNGDNSTLVKIDAATGEFVWTIPCERTNSIPIVVDDRIYLSAGLLGFGSAPKVQAFADQGATAVKLWDTFVDSGGTLFVGGWTHQPVHSNGRLIAGAIPSGFPFFGPNTDLYALDLSMTPNDLGFVTDHITGFGSSPAVCNGRLYSTGASGLFAIATRGDFCGNSGTPDGAVTIDDLDCFVAALLDEQPSTASPIGDFNGDDLLNGSDIHGFLAALTDQQ